MQNAADKFPIVREAVASFADREHFHKGVTGLLAAGFAPDDLSVLASHDSLDVAGEAGYGKEAHRWLPAGLAEEIKYLGPLTIAGIIVLSGGPIAASLAALVGAGLGGAAIKEVLDRITANRHSAEFAAALQAGAVLLWVRCADPALEAVAARHLDEAGGRYVHIHARQSTGAAP